MSTATSAIRKSSGSAATASRISPTSTARSGCRIPRGSGRLHVVQRRARLRAARRGAQPRVEGVAQGAHEIPALVAPDHARTGQDARERLLHEVLRVFPGSAQRPGSAVERVQVLAKRLRVQAAHHRMLRARSGSRGSGGAGGRRGRPPSSGPAARRSRRGRPDRPRRPPARRAARARTPTSDTPPARGARPRRRLPAGPGAADHPRRARRDRLEGLEPQLADLGVMRPLLADGPQQRAVGLAHLHPLPAG